MIVVNTQMQRISVHLLGITFLKQPNVVLIIRSWNYQVVQHVHCLNMLYI